MGRDIFIDFSIIGDVQDFYQQLEEKLTLIQFFGENLDALYDSITGDLEMPLHIEFVNMSVDQLETFEDLIGTMERAEEVVKDFSFSYFLEQYD